MVRSLYRSAIARRLNIAVFAPTVLLLAVGAVLAYQVVRMTRDAAWVDHSHEVISKAHEVHKEISQQESGFRGYLLTADESFLEPYRDARPLDRLHELRKLVSDDPEQVARADAILRHYEDWFEQVAPLANERGLARATAASGVRARNELMQRLNDSLEALLVAENAVRVSRSAAAAASSDRTRIAFIFLMLGTAAVLGLLSRNQIRWIATSFEKSLEQEATAREQIEREQWLRAGQLRVAEEVQGDNTIGKLGEKVLGTLAPYVHADVGAFFAAEPNLLRMQASYGIARDHGGAQSFGPREGLVGRAADERALIRVRDVPPQALAIRSGTVSTDPAEIVLVPAEVDGAVHAVVELGFLKPPDARTLELLERVRGSIALASQAAEHRRRLRELLEASQRQAEELQTQQEELRVANEELQEQGNALREAHRQLEERQSALEAINARLEEQTSALQQAERTLKEKAAEVERASQYKSEFLANMSHELRTPLNSSLILSKLLADNKNGNLSDEQVKFAETIYAAGNDLLALINDILDLSKIEAGRLDVRFSPVSIQRVVDGLRRTFEPLASNKGLAFTVDIEPSAPTTLETDAQRLEQILKNLLSNAIKFTDEGQVSLQVGSSDGSIRFVVADTGIGIAPDDREAVFEAFHQVDGSADRRHGGTGLGLSISRQLSHLLGGKLELTSELGKGSEFSLSLPVDARASEPARAPRSAFEGQNGSSSRGARPAESERRSTSERPSTDERRSASEQPARPPAFEDDRDRIDSSRRVVLVVEDDVRFARILCDLARELDFQCLVAHEADTGIGLARDYVPSAVVLDVNLPDHTGLSVLDRLKRDSATRHIPVHVISVEDRVQEAMSMGAVGYLKKPAAMDDLVKVFRDFETKLERDMRRLLIVEDDTRQRDSLEHLLGGGGVETVAVGTVADALAALRATTFDCMVTDLTLPDASGFDLLERLGEGDLTFPPVVIYTGRALTADEEQKLRKYTSSIVVKGARSPERLLDEVTLFLHRVESELPRERQRMLREARDRESAFEGRRILIVEDDVRNVFALSSVLEPKGAKVLIARNGREALETLGKTPDIDLVLMDIMMPEMDGIAATQAIRRDSRFGKVPIIALTAKAMRDDQERCLQAGANDYIPKPLDVDMLLSLLRVWMPR